MKGRYDMSTPSTELPALPGFEWALPMTATVLQAQRMQLEAMLAWQQSFVALQKEAWDEWVARWAGGAPIDA